MNARRSIATAVALVAILLVGTAATASAKPKPTQQPKVVAEDLAGPLGLAVSNRGDVYVAQSFAGLLTKVGSPQPLAVASGAPQNAIDGVDVTRDGKILYTSTGRDENGDPVSAHLNVVGRNGQARPVADLLAYEQAHNPDAGQSYGFQDLPAGCEIPPPPEGEQPIPATPYPGLVDSHPYAVADLGFGFSAVADAGANAVTVVDPWGNPHTLAVLPPQPLVVPAEGAAALGLPDCAIGSTFNFEPVPTDVEVGPFGLLFVTTLPGGPEGPELGARGSVYAVNMFTGRTFQVATGLAGATDLAVTPKGLFVTELFGNQVSRIVGGHPVPVQELTNPAAVEWAHGKLYVADNVFGAGRVVTLTS